MTQKFANAARATLATGIASGDTAITISSGGALFPEIASPDFARAVLQDESGIEIVLITAHTASSTSFTVTRAQEGTTARSFAAGSIFGIRLTSADGDTFAAKVSGPASATDSALAAFDGTTGKLVKQAATVTVPQGGTGASTLTANNVLLGNGTSALQAVAPSTSGNVLTSNGTTWTSSAPPAQVYPGAGLAVSTGTAWGTSKTTPTGDVVGTTDTQTLTNKQLTDPTLADSLLTRAMIKDSGYAYFNSGTTNALDYTNGSHQRWAPSTGAQTLSITNWPPSGNLGELLIEGVNLGASTITWPTINWITSTGATTTTFSSNGVTLQTSGTDWILLWTRDAGTTIYGKIVR